MRSFSMIPLVAAFMVAASCAAEPEGLAPLEYRRSDLTVDLGVELWEWPIPGDADGISDFLGGAEDGRMYYLRNPRGLSR